MSQRILLIGLGGLGATILELLARQEPAAYIVAAARNADRGMRRCNLARLGAMAQGYRPRIGFQPLDLTDPGRVAEVVHDTAPTVILSTASMLTWWLPDLLPEPQATRIRAAGFGAWLPVHFTLTRKLMEAVRAAGYAGHTVTAPFPDVVNHMLGRIDLAPTCGIGNLDEIVPKLQRLAAERLGIWPDLPRVTLVAHHALESAVYGGWGNDPPPYFLRIEHAGRDVTTEIDAASLLFAPYELPAGPVTHFLTAGSAVRLIQALHRDKELYLHAPAPGGLPGGYPVLVSSAGVRPAPIDGLPLDAAVRINERSHPFDGIAQIEEDGSAVFCPETVAVLREELGYDCDRLAPDEAEDRAHELIERFGSYAAQQGVDIRKAEVRRR